MAGPNQINDAFEVPQGAEWVLAADPELDLFVQGIIHLRQNHGGIFPITSPHTAAIFMEGGLPRPEAETKALRCIRILQVANLLAPLPDKYQVGPDYYPQWDFPGQIPNLGETTKQ